MTRDGAVLCKGWVQCAPQEALRDCERAFQNFWRGRRQGLKVGFPRFKKKGRDDSFRLTGAIRVTKRGVVLPRIGEVRTKESTEKFGGRILSATVRREADRWYVSLTVERERPEPEKVQGAPVGIDLGLEAFATTSDGERMEAPKPLKRCLGLLIRRSRQHSRKQRGSANRRKSALRLARLHRRIRNIRDDRLHKRTTHLAKTKPVIVVEDLSVRGMMRNRHLARSIADAAWGRFVRMLDYKTKWYGSELRKIGRFEPSTSRCSRCGHIVGRLPLSQRIFRCPSCGHTEHRDTNAAKSILQIGLQDGTESSSGTCSYERTPVEIPLAAEHPFGPACLEGRPAPSRQAGGLRAMSRGSRKQTPFGRLSQMGRFCGTVGTDETEGRKKRAADA